MTAKRSSEPWRRVLSRRRLVQTGVGVAALSVSTSCGRRASSGAPSGGQNASSAQPKSGGTLNYAGGPVGSWDTQGRSFDPMITTQTGARSLTLYYERLLGNNVVTHEVQPELAMKWEQASPTEYVFHLQPNVKWQNKPPVNGRLMTTDDVLWSFQRAQTNDPKFYTRSLLTNVNRIEAPDASTIKFTMKAADASTLNKLSTDNLVVLSRESLRKESEAGDGRRRRSGRALF